MTYDNLTALIGFAFVMSVSPGPSNFLLLTSGANFGIRRTVPLILGISSGFLSMVFVVGLGFGQILQAHEFIYLGLKIVCVAYVLWLAWKIANITSMASGNGDTGSTPIGFAQAAAFQLVNPKAWAVALIVTVSYTSREEYFTSLVTMIGVFAMVNLPSISTWAVFGTALRRLLATDRRVRTFNIAMAMVLVASMVPVILAAAG